MFHVNTIYIAMTSIRIFFLFFFNAEEMLNFVNENVSSIFNRIIYLINLLLW